MKLLSGECEEKTFDDMAASIPWGNVDQDLCHHMASLDYNELNIREEGLWRCMYTR